MITCIINIQDLNDIGLSKEIIIFFRVFNTSMLRMSDVYGSGFHPRLPVDGSGLRLRPLTDVLDRGCAHVLWSMYWIGAAPTSYGQCIGSGLRPRPLATVLDRGCAHVRKPNRQDKAT